MRAEEEKEEATREGARFKKGNSAETPGDEKHRALSQFSRAIALDATNGTEPLLSEPTSAGFDPSNARGVHLCLVKRKTRNSWIMPFKRFRDESVLRIRIAANIVNQRASLLRELLAPFWLSMAHA